jgi:hypothetical protein
MAPQAKREQKPSPASVEVRNLRLNEDVRKRINVRVTMSPGHKTNTRITIRNLAASGKADIIPAA